MSKPEVITYADIPKAVNILGQIFKVELRDLPSSEYGETRGYEKLIIINRKQPKSTALHTLFHECIHAALHVSGHTSTLKHNQEESLVMMLEAAFGDCIDITVLGDMK